MLGKLLLMAVLGVVALFVYENGRTIDESHVREHYRQQLEALRNFDEECICAGIADEYSLRMVERGASGATSTTLDGAQSCEMSRKSLRFAQQLSTQTGGLLTIEADYDLKSIRIAPDGRSAVVEATSTAKVGDTLVSRVRGREQLSRSFWRVRSHGGEARVWSYGG
ncbi:hypothetical protein [Luteimonas sp. SDU101]|uniref:hypothetical protein n=1 Tax=Luteimonas sp. SDU101 TaxID=3422593 RepID=UPI003EBF86D4